MHILYLKQPKTAGLQQHLVSECVVHAEVRAPVEVVGGEVFCEEASIAGSEVNLQGQWGFELVLQSDDCVGAALAEVVARHHEAEDPLVLDVAPAVADASAKARQPVKSSDQVPFEHEVRVQFHRPEGNPLEVHVLETAAGGDVCRAQIHLEGEMVAAKGLERQGLHGACGNAESVFVRRLCIDS